MAQISTVKRLDPEIREEVNRLLDHGQTLDSILAHLRTLGVTEISRSALGRYKQSFDQVVERVRRSREIADVLVRRFGTEDENKAMRANLEMMHGIVSDMLLQIGEDEDGRVSLEPKEAAALARTLSSLATATRADQEALQAARAEAAREAEAKLERAAEQVEGEGPMTAAQMKERMLAVYRGEA